MICSFRVRIFLIIWISALINVFFASGSRSAGFRRSIERARLRAYINRHIDEYVTLTGKPVSDSDRDATLDDFTHDRMFSLSPTLKLIEIAELQIILDEERVHLNYNQECSVVDQAAVDAFYYSAISDSEDTLRRTYDHLKGLADSGKSYCRFFSYLVCRADPENPGSNRCLCPPTSLTWRNNKCVFKKNQRCDDLEDFYLQGAFPTFDFIQRLYVTNVQPLCELNYQCKPGSNLCEFDSDSNIYVPQAVLIAFLRNRITPDKSGLLHFEQLVAMMRFIVMDITAPHKEGDYRAASLEWHMTQLLQEHGQTCDQSADAPLDELMKPYGRPGYYKDLSDTRLNRDPLRQVFQLMVMKLGTSVKVCNHLNLLRCTDAGTCDCKESLAWDSSSSVCVTKSKFPCPSHVVKQLSLSLPFTGSAFPTYGTSEKYPYSVPYSSISNISELWPDYGRDFSSETLLRIFFNLHYYEAISTVCEPGTGCKTIGEPDTQDFCLKPDESAVEVAVLVHDSRSKFSLEFDDDCSPTDHAQLFLQLTISSSLGSPLDLVQSTLETINSSPSKYCNIRNHATCSSAGKCTCVPPSILEDNMCISPYHGECGHIKSDFHQELDKLTLPLTDPSTLTSTDNLFCPSHLICYDDTFIKKKLCTCIPDLYGKGCDVIRNRHVGLIVFEYLPTSLHTLDGRKLIAEFHEAMFQLERLMTAGTYGQPCKPGDHMEIENIIKFTSDFKDICQCERTYSGHACDTFPCRTNPEFSKEAIEAIIQKSKDLVGKPASLCRRTEGFICIYKVCGCEEDLFYVNNGCFADLGAEGCGDTIIYSPTEIISRECRPGTACRFGKEGIGIGKYSSCTSTNRVTRDISAEGLTTEEYVNAVNKKLVEFLNNSATRLMTLQTTHENQHCNPSSEKIHGKLMLLLDPVLGTIKEGDVQHERREVRLMETMATEAYFFLDGHTEFCRPSLECNPDTNRCERKEKPAIQIKASAPRILKQQIILFISILTLVVF